MPRRIQLRRTKGWRMPEGAIKVDRSTRWGNPWRIGELGIPDAATAVRRFRAAILGFDGGDGSWCRPNAHPDSYIGRIIANAARELGGLDLACWCGLCERHRDGKPLGEHCTDCDPCHGDPLIELANP
jgi:hypothetical protein